MPLSQHICATPKPMTFPINLNRQFQLRAVEIHNEVMDRFLSHKLIAKHFSPF